MGELDEVALSQLWDRWTNMRVLGRVHLLQPGEIQRLFGHAAGTDREVLYGG